MLAEAILVSVDQKHKSYIYFRVALLASRFTAGRLVVEAHEAGWFGGVRVLDCAGTHTSLIRPRLRVAPASKPMVRAKRCSVEARSLPFPFGKVRGPTTMMHVAK